MFECTITHPTEGQEPIKFETEDRKLARMAAQLAKAIGVEYKCTVEVKAREVSFKNL